jgi:predicted polyphosphate/ATP-dependent NAD kinase
MITDYILEQIREGIPYILPPGEIESTVKKLGSTDLGLDAIQKGAIVTSGADKHTLMEILKKKRGKIIKTIQPGQRYLFERNSEGVSQPVLREIRKENVIVLASSDGLASLNGSPLIVDTGDPTLNEQLSGFYSVSLGHRKRAIYKAVPSDVNPRFPEN